MDFEITAQSCLSFQALSFWDKIWALLKASPSKFVRKMVSIPKNNAAGDKMKLPELLCSPP